MIGYEIFVRDKVLYFRSPPSAAQPSDRLSLGQDITEFSPRLSTLSQVSEVTVRGWDVKEKTAVVGSMAAAPGSGAAAARRAFGAASVASLGQRCAPRPRPIPWPRAASTPWR